MKIKLLTSIAGNADPANGLERDFAFAHGEVVEVADGLGRKWIGSNLAEAVSGALRPAAAAPPKKTK